MNPMMTASPLRGLPSAACPSPRTCLALGVAALISLTAQAQQAPATRPASEAAGALQPVVISGGSAASERWLGTATVDVVEGSELRDGQAQINLSEGLARVPGLVIRNRQNYAQDQQISIRGYGARTPFGVRGVRLFVDGIPASSADGQGQTEAFALGIADRVEVVRGPFSALYGASSGGAILMYTEEGARPAEWRAGAVVGPDGLWRLSTQATGQTGDASQPGWSYAVNLSAFGTEGARPQSSADRQTANLKLARSHEGGRTVLLFNHVTGFAEDPQGLNADQFAQNPRQTTPGAIQYNTRKQLTQDQVGVAFDQALGNGHKLELMGYFGQRSTLGFQSTPASTQSSALSPGGVIDLNRDYWGLNARWRLDRSYDSGRLAMSAGLVSDQQRDDRKGYQNFIGTAPSITYGVQGVLRRDETNRAKTLDPYAQAEWQTANWAVSGAVRHSRTELSSVDHYLADGKDGSGARNYDATLPVLGGRLTLLPGLQAFASVGRGFETPTLNEVAYLAGGVAGLNTQLNAARSHSAELGLRGRVGNGWWSSTLFDIRTSDEIVVAGSTDGRTAYKNQGHTRRQGLELSGEYALGPVVLNGAYTYLNATYSETGNLMPGVSHDQLYAQAAWATGWAGSVLALEARQSGKVAVNDANSLFASGYTLFNFVARFEQRDGPWTWSEFLRLDNLTNRTYAGSVIVNDSNSRYFEPGMRRAPYLGVQLSRRFD
ncbi:MAG: hypothetical protein RJA36_56 [Pseudomonadota bacterium]|jgi:iron complex outermembrane receptor protein